jgi:hypothetical protein
MTKEEWSIPTWYFMHGFAEKINSEFYKNNYVNCWILVYKNICNNLPCPICRYHASNYIKNIKHSDINTKEKLINYIYEFHNDVNIKLGKNIYPKHKLNIYKNLILHAAFNKMYKNITKSYYGSKVFGGWRRRKGLVITLNYLKKIWENIN